MRNWFCRTKTNEKLYEFLKNNVRYENNNCKKSCRFCIHKQVRCDLFYKYLKIHSSGKICRCSECKTLIN